MQLYPAIDLKDGKCVRLMQGDYDKMTVYGDPVEMAKKWEAQGATYLHLVDLDGAKCGESINDEVIRSITQAVKIKTEVGGGIRTLEAIEAKLNMGVTRVILGSKALEDPAFVKTAIEKFGADKVVVGVDAKGGKVAVEGWLKVSETSAIDFAKELKKIGVKTIIYTDIAKDGMMQGPNIEETRKMIESSGLEIVASGGISCMEDLERVHGIDASGVIIGKAIYLDKVDLKKACALYEGGESNA